MKRLALLFIIAVMIPCSVLAWLAYRAMNEEQRAFQDQQIALAQEKTDALAARSQALLEEQLREFERSVDLVLANGLQPTTSAQFHQTLLDVWPMAQSGFLWNAPPPSTAPMVSLSGAMGAREQGPSKSELTVAEEAVETEKLSEKMQVQNDGKAETKAAENRPMAKMKDSRASSDRVADAKDAAKTVPLPATRSSAARENTPSEIVAPASAGAPLRKESALADVPAKPAPAREGMADLVTPSTPLGKPGSEMVAPASPAPLLDNIAVGADEPTEPTSAAPAGAALAAPPAVAAAAPALPSAARSTMKADSPLQSKRLRAEPKNRDRQEFSLEFQRATPDPIVTQRRLVAPEHLSPQHHALFSSLSLHTAPIDLGNAVQSKVSGIQGHLTPEGNFALLAWYRPARTSDTIFAAEISTTPLVQHLLESLTSVNSDTFCLTILDHTITPVVKSSGSFQTDWARPYVSSELGANLPQWEAAAFLLSPDALRSSAQAAKWKLGLMVLAVVAAALLGAGLLWFEARQRWLESRQKTDFVSQVSHELKTPLTSIRMFSDLLAQNTDHPEPEKTQRYAAVISQEAGRLSRLINSVLDFSRLERGNLPMQCSPRILQDIVSETVEHYRPHLESLGFTLSTELPSVPLTVHVDADRISQIILNLLSNAEKYSGDGREIEVHLNSNSTTASLTISDRGPGVPHGKEKRIFEKFFRAHDCLHSGIPGTGLGLALAREIARAHRGDLVYQRRPGSGSQFVLTIPLG